MPTATNYADTARLFCENEITQEEERETTVHKVISRMQT